MKKNICVSSTGYSMPPVIITVDYGDGSGEQSWSRAAPANLWTHMYQLPGRYWVHVSSESLIIPVILNYFIFLKQRLTSMTGRVTSCGARWRW